VERDRALVHRRGDAAHDRPRARAGDVEEALVQEPPDSAAAMLGRHADEVDVGLVGLRLGQEPGQEPRQLAAVLGHERRVREVDEEEPRQHVDHLAAAPPLVDERGDAVVVGGHGRAHGDRAVGYGATTVTVRDSAGSQRRNRPPG
jgi:hypothetical protein